MNLTNRVRRVIAIAALASSIAGAAGVAGAAHADSTAPIEPVPTAAPSEPTSDEAPPGGDVGIDDSGVAAPTTTTPPPPTEPAPPPAADEDDVAPAPSSEPQSAIATTATPAADDFELSLLATAPSAPLSPIASPLSQTVWLYWNPPASDGGSPIIQYEVQWATGANGPWQFFATTANKYYKASSGNWSNGTRYYFRILAHNAVGAGAPSAVVSAIPHTVPSKPEVCSSWHEGYTYWGNTKTYNIRTTWVAGSNGGSPITSYKVTAWKNGSYYTHGVTNVFLATSLDITVFSAGTYTVTVQAGNAAGYGAACTRQVYVYN